MRDFVLIGSAASSLYAAPRWTENLAPNQERRARSGRAAGERESVAMVSTEGWNRPGCGW